MSEAAGIAPDEIQRLREEAQCAAGFGRAEGVEVVEWADHLAVGDVIEVEPADGREAFAAPVRGFSSDRRWYGEPLVHRADVPWDADGCTAHFRVREHELGGVVCPASEVTGDAG